VRWLALLLIAEGVAACDDDTRVNPVPFDAAPDVTLDASIDGPPDVVVPRGSRVLGLDIEAAEDGDYVAALARAKDAGIQSTNVTILWRDLEATGDGGVEAGITYFNPLLHIANLVFPPNEIKASLAIVAVDTVGPVVPPDLTGRPIDDPAVIDRFNLAQDYVFGEIADLSLTMYVIGNEIDAPFAGDPAKYAAYKTFFDAAAAHARSKRAALKVGPVLRLSGALADHDALRPLVASADFLGITYFPLDSNYSVRPPSTVHADLAQVAQLFPDKPVLVREAGYPSSSVVGGSPDAQANFVQELYRAWDENAARVPLLTFFTMHEYSPNQVDDFAAYYGVSDPKFKEYFGTLGLRTFAGHGTDKPGWGAFQAGARARGW
jgi:hypothetical protein